MSASIRRGNVRSRIGRQHEATRVREGHRRGRRARGVAVAGLLAEAAHAQAQAAGVPAPEAMGPESRKAFAELLALVAEAERRTLSAEWNVRSPQDVIDGHRVLLHLLAASIDLYYEGDPERPYCVPMPSPTRKYLGDNPDAHYFFTRAARRPPLPHPRQHRRRGLHLLHVPVGDQTGAAARHHRGAQPHAVRRRGRRQLRARDRPGRERPERRAARRQDRLGHHAPLLRERALGAARSERAHPALDRAGWTRSARRRRSSDAESARRIRAAAGFFRAEHARHAPARSEAAARVGLDRAEPARRARAPGRAPGRLGVARRGQRLQHGAVSAEARRGARDDAAACRSAASRTWCSGTAGWRASSTAASASR